MLIKVFAEVPEEGYVFYGFPVALLEGKKKEKDFIPHPRLVPNNEEFSF